MNKSFCCKKPAPNEGWTRTRAISTKNIENIQKFTAITHSRPIKSSKPDTHLLQNLAPTPPTSKNNPSNLQSLTKNSKTHHHFHLTAPTNPLPANANLILPCHQHFAHFTHCIGSFSMLKCWRKIESWAKHAFLVDFPITIISLYAMLLCRLDSLILRARKKLPRKQGRGKLSWWKKELPACRGNGGERREWVLGRTGIVCLCEVRGYDLSNDRATTNGFRRKMLMKAMIIS